jgi:hypothetical protein
MQNLEIQTIDIIDLASVTGGADGPAPNPAPANPGVNRETYNYAGGEIGRAAGEILGSETAAKHLQTAGQAIGRGIYNAGDWLGTQAGRLLYGN